MRYRHLQWLPVRRAVPRFGMAAAAEGEVAITDENVPAHDPRLTPRDEATFLLHTAAEIEHALMVQYLYAAYSLLETPPVGPGIPADARQLLRMWRRTILQIAREEMGHLLTVENLLRFIGGPLTFDREDFPFLSAFYPFPFTLERLTRNSLAKYVAAEMPEDAAEPEIPDIVRRAREIAGMPINRVGALYDRLIAIFTSELADGDFSPDTAGREGFQAHGDDWFGGSAILVRQAATRADAVDALRRIAEQGEGAESAADSHFERFLGIYRQFPETEWDPARSVPTDPNTAQAQAEDAEGDSMARGRITDPLTRLWAQLFNVRYRMLLTDLSHALHLEGPAPQEGTGHRSRLRDWTFQEMRGQEVAGLKGLAGKLMTLPQHAGSAGPPFAGPPFELPYTLELPDRERDRWRLHRDLIDLSGRLIGKIEAEGADDILDELKALDAAARGFIETQLGA